MLKSENSISFMEFMKTRIFIVLVAFAFGFCLSVSAQDFSTGSDFMNSGSNYSSNVGAVGSTGANAMYETTADAPAGTQRPGARKLNGGGDMGDQSDESPIGEPLIMLLFAAAAGAVVAIRRRHTA